MKNNSTIVAYPNFTNDSNYIKPMYNLNKWLDAMREIYTSVHFGNNLKDSFANTTSSWDTVEKRDFESWMQYYQSDNQNKYKTAFANFYVNENIPGYFIPNTPKQPIPPPIVPDVSEPIEAVRHSVNETISKEEKRKKMEEQRKKIIGRLNAAVKHLTSHEGHLLAGEEFDKLLAGMYELIKQFQTVNKISLSNKLYYDLIIRQANKLSRDGFNRSAKFLSKFAQNNSGTLDASGPLPIGSAQTGVAGGTLDNPVAPTDAIAPPISNPEEDDVIDELFDNLETAGLTDANFSEDDEDDEDDLEKEILLEDDLMVEAQLAPTPAPQTPPPSPTTVSPAIPNTTVPTAKFQDDLEVSLPDEPVNDEKVNEVIIEKSIPDKKNIDAMLDGALSNITIIDIVRKIEDVNAIFQNRTIARELSIIDLMLSTLGLSSYFNNLSEIIQKNHEASNYSISRLSDILTKLRGAISDDNIDLKEPSEMSPEVKQLQQKLQNQKDIEEERKEKRRKLQDEALDEEVNEQIIPNPIAVKPSEEIANVPSQIV